MIIQEDFAMGYKHDWYDDYKAYSRMNAGRTNGRSGGDDWGILLMILLPLLGMPIFYLGIVILDLIVTGLWGFLGPLLNNFILYLRSFAV